MKDIFIMVFPVGFVVGAALALMAWLISYTIYILIRTLRK